MKTYKIPIIAGDGVGPEVIAEGKRTLEAAGRAFGFEQSTTSQRESFCQRVHSKS